MSKETIIENLRNIVVEWREASDNQNLEEVQTPVKLILNEVCNLLDTNPTEIGL